MRCGKMGVEGKLHRWNWKERQKQKWTVTRENAQGERHQKVEIVKKYRLMKELSNKRKNGLE